MAGIAGIIVKNTELIEVNLKNSFASMMQKLSFSDLQLKKSFTSKNICFGNIVPVSCRINEHYQHNNELGVYAVIDGLVFIDRNERSILDRRYNIVYNQSDYTLIPILYDCYKEDFVKHITGWFNVFIYDDKRKLSLLINDRLGFLPLYYCDLEFYFIFASKVESILNSGLLPTIQADAATVAEHLFFNYPLSDHTYIENICTLSNAEFFKIRPNSTISQKYWSISELYGYEPADKHESFRLMDEGLKKAVGKAISRCESKINLSLTGGWDSRVVLSYLLPQYGNKLNMYSFGAEQSNDILIPQQIADAEEIDYTPYILDQNYLDHFFLPNALKTIELSNGTRHYKRTHYFYTIQKIADISSMLVTGIFGDEVFKITRPTGGAVLSQNMVNLLKSDFYLDGTIHEFANSFIPDCLNIDRKTLIDAFSERLDSLKRRMGEFETKSQKYLAYRFEYNLRKYFGQEASSYNDFLFCFSPFVDFDFIAKFSRTQYFGVYYPFGSNSILLKKQSTELYHDIVHANYKPLTEYNSGRGYSMKAAKSFLGHFKIIYKRYSKRKANIDRFNTKPTDDLFRSYLKSQNVRPHAIKCLEKTTDSGSTPDILSLIYWFEIIKERYDLQA